MSAGKIKFKSEFSVVIVNYKTHKLTSICLNLLKKAFSGTNVQVWVIDNDSKDESTEYLRTLDWIHFIERKSTSNEAGHIAHGRALDVVLDLVSTEYLFILHSDTFVYDAEIFNIMLEECINNSNIAAVGCVEQVYRKPLRLIFRLIKRFIKYYFRRIKQLLNIKSKSPKAYYEVHLKSFCALWNARVMKEKGLTFIMENGNSGHGKSGHGNPCHGNPGYEAQNRLIEYGYKITHIPAKKIFKYLDHVKGQTIDAKGKNRKNRQSTNIYNNCLKKIG